GEAAVTAGLKLLVGGDGGDGLAGLLRLAQAGQHLGTVTARPGGPLEGSRDPLLRGPGGFPPLGEGLVGLGVLPGGLLEALPGGVAVGAGLGGLGGGQVEGVEPLGAAGLAEVVDREGAVREALLVGQELELLGGLVVVARGALDQAEGEAVAGGADLLV